MCVCVCVCRVCVCVCVCRVCVCVACARTLMNMFVSACVCARACTCFSVLPLCAHAHVCICMFVHMREGLSERESERGFVFRFQTLVWRGEVVAAFLKWYKWWRQTWE